MTKKVKCPKCLGTGIVQDQKLVGRMMKFERAKSLRETAECMGITPSHLCLLESGKRRWSPELVAKYKECCR